MKKSEQKKLLKTGRKFYKKLTRRQQLVVAVVVLIGLAVYFLPSQFGDLKSFSNQNSQANSDFLKLKWAGSDDYFTEVNGGRATFTQEELRQDSEEDYWLTFSALDALDRAQQANARLSYDQYMAVKTMKRPRIPNDPIGWYHDGKSNNQEIYFGNGLVTLYNRSHLVAWMFSGDAGSKENLVTGTRAMNSPGMQEFETAISDVLYYERLHVRYQVTPIYEGAELLPRGVHLMAKSIEDDGKACDFNVYVFNVQPNYTIDYATGVGTFKG
ncbi:hypothetical protein Hs30E_06860 [Lactococcus hodotermopsidis]|uniref:Type VII secretion system protein EssD-like domain-containing protein n=1 Tax=Pseudolactococcus hodotermopsidis TaxID=2709157 RepID=A0A6A0BBU8_9LACT|nr:DNA/RNA non-specific endonuclease [Lactococcus hodotermopsidis]GFH42135.1 hypothetical protein Hs30E_06860 [Lactococcus hodotermopsidis]